MGKKRPKDPHSRQAAFEMLTKQAVVESFLDEGQIHTRQACILTNSWEYNHLTFQSLLLELPL